MTLGKGWLAYKKMSSIRMSLLLLPTLLYFVFDKPIFVLIGGCWLVFSLIASKVNVAGLLKKSLVVELEAIQTVSDNLQARGISDPKSGVYGYVLDNNVFRIIFVVPSEQNLCVYRNILRKGLFYGTTDQGYFIMAPSDEDVFDECDTYLLQDLEWSDSKWSHRDFLEYVAMQTGKEAVRTSFIYGAAYKRLQQGKVAKSTHIKYELNQLKSDALCKVELDEDVLLYISKKDLESLKGDSSASVSSAEE